MSEPVGGWQSSIPEYRVQIVVSRHSTLKTRVRHAGKVEVLGIEIHAIGFSQGITRGFAMLGLLPVLFIIAAKNVGAFADYSILDIALIGGIAGAIAGAFGWVVQQLSPVKARAMLQADTIALGDSEEMIKARCADGRYLYVFPDPRAPDSFRELVGKMKTLKIPRQSI